MYNQPYIPQILNCSFKTLNEKFFVLANELAIEYVTRTMDNICKMYYR